MRVKLPHVLLLLVLSAAPAYADPVVVTFNEAPAGGRVPVYTEQGFGFCCNVLISQLSAGNFAIESNSNHITAPNVISINYLGGQQFDFVGVDFVFSYGTDVFRASNGVTLVYDPRVGVGSQFTGITWLEWIHYGVGGDRGPSPASIDNLRFNTSPAVATPEPATLVLLGSGLLGAAGAARRRRRRAD